MFKTTSPANFRPDVDDVIVLLTDGEPRGKRDTPKLTMQYGQELKDRNISMVVAGVGRESEKPKFQQVHVDRPCQFSRLLRQSSIRKDERHFEQTC